MKGNKGEWSEFYALCKMINDEEIYVSDNDVGQIELKQLHSIIKKGTTFLFFDKEDNFECISADSRSLSKHLLNLDNNVEKLLHCIKNAGCEQKEGNVFEIGFAEELAGKICADTNKSKSQDKADLSLKFRLNDIGSETKMHDVSIKSWLGSSPSLFNASSKSSRLIFEVITDLPFSFFNEFSSEDMISRKPREGIIKAIQNGAQIKFVSFAHKNFEQNLKSFNAHELIPEIVLRHFLKSEDESTTSSVLERIIDEQHSISFRHTWKTFLEKCALGMTAAKKYTDDQNISDNILAIDTDGSLCCFIGRNRLQDLLYRHVYIDTPSTKKTKHNYGFFYQKEGKIYIDLNFGIRMKANFAKR